jgi:SH3-like domain-containing protein
MAGKGKRMRGGGLNDRLGRILAALILAASAGMLLAADRATPSGLPVPRYVSLKFDEVNARAGPGDDYRLLWIYRARGLPVQVVAETAEWRRVCDPEGGLAWVHKRTTDGRRMVMNIHAAPAALRRSPKPTSSVVAALNPRALAALIRCSKGWCKVKADDDAGWADADELWGMDETPQCR